LYREILSASTAGTVIQRDAPGLSVQPGLRLLMRWHFCSLALWTAPPVEKVDQFQTAKFQNRGEIMGVAARFNAGHLWETAQVIVNDNGFIAFILKFCWKT
jgi:hypothetical protein